MIFRKFAQNLTLMLIKKWSAFALIFFGLSAFASAQQDMTITGTVYDTSGTVPLKNAVAQAVRVKDSLLLGFARTNASGTFKLGPMKLDTFQLIVSHPSFDDKFYYIFGDPANADINIPKIQLNEQAQELEEVVIYANSNPIFYKGDTLVYLADSFQVAEHAVVEDLLKKLPGLEIDENGQIKSQGKDIDKVLVDGDEFFGSDPTIATQNLGAKGVEQVQVYEKKEENAGEGEETIQVLDLRLKDDAKKGYFGRASMGTDFVQFYEGELLYNNFNKDRKISVFVLGANTPKSNFGFGDRNKFGLENEGRSSRFDGDGIFIDFGNNQNIGIPQTLKSGIYYTDKLGKKNQHKVGFNYSYYNTNLDAISASRSQYYLQDSVFFSDDSTRSVSNDETHRVNLRFESQLDSLTSIEFRPQFTVTGSNTNNTDLSYWSDANNDLQRTNTVTNTNELQSTAVTSDFKLNRNFMKKRRELNLRYLFDGTDDASEGVLTNENRYTSPIPTSTFDQQRTQTRVAQGHTASMTYYEPLGKKWKLQFDYIYDYTVNRQDRLTFGYVDSLQAYTARLDDFSNEFTTTRDQHRAGSQIWYETRKHTFFGGARYRTVFIENLDRENGVVTPQNVNNILPTFTYRYNPSNAKRMTVRYRTNSQQPSIADLQPVQDNTNPNFIRIGNKNLLPNYVHNVDVSFNTYNAIRGRYIYVGGSGSLTEDAFGDSTTIGAFGTQISQTVNVDGNRFAVIYAGAGVPFWNRKFMIRPNLSSFISQNVSYINGERNVGINRNYSANIGYAFMFDSLEINFMTNYVYNSPSNTLASIRTQNFTTQSYFAGFKWTIPGRIRLEANANYQMNGQRAAGFGVNFLIVNASVSKFFMETENLELSLLMNDILNQNINAQRQIQGNIVTDNLTQIISRYYLLKLTYRFNNRKAKEEDERGWF